MNPCSDENDASQTMAALGPLHRITEAGAAVLLVHHPRKGDAAEGQAARGSGALAGFVDTIVELRRFNPESADDRRRELKGLSRFDETPSEVVIELTDSGYHTIGSVGEATQSDRIRVITQILSESNEPCTADDVRSGWPDGTVPKPGRRTVMNDLNVGFKRSEWCRTGSGKRGDPFRYFPNGNANVQESNQTDHQNSIRARSQSYTHETNLPGRVELAESQFVSAPETTIDEWGEV
jgi:hypothetical protein